MIKPILSLDDFKKWMKQQQEEEVDLNKCETVGTEVMSK